MQLCPSFVNDQGQLLNLQACCRPATGNIHQQSTCRLQRDI
jgi:hypothetical protein